MLFIDRALLYAEVVGDVANQDPQQDAQATRPHYHPIGIAFHWAMAALVFFQIGWGWWTSLQPAGYAKVDAYAIHALCGMILLALAFLRAGWRTIAPFILPALEKPEDLPGWQRRAAEATHIALYALMFVLPLSGWLMLSAGATSNQIHLAFGLSAPALPFTAELSFIESAHLEQTAETIHFYCVWALMALVSAHIGAALKHHFIDRDDVLARILPILARAEASGARSRSADTTANAAR